MQRDLEGNDDMDMDVLIEGNAIVIKCMSRLSERVSFFKQAVILAVSPTHDDDFISEQFCCAVLNLNCYS